MKKKIFTIMLGLSLALVGCGQQSATKSSPTATSTSTFIQEDTLLVNIVDAVFKGDNEFLYNRDNKDVTQDFVRAMQENYDKKDYEAIFAYLKKMEYVPSRVDFGESDITYGEKNPLFVTIVDAVFSNHGQRIFNQEGKDVTQTFISDMQENFDAKDYEAIRDYFSQHDLVALHNGFKN